MNCFKVSWLFITHSQLALVLLHSGCFFFPLISAFDWALKEDYTVTLTGIRDLLWCVGIILIRSHVIFNMSLKKVVLSTLLILALISFSKQSLVIKSPCHSALTWWNGEKKNNSLALYLLFQNNEHHPVWIIPQIKKNVSCSIYTRSSCHKRVYLESLLH